MIVAIDGPAGAGKSSVARKLAERLGFQFLDTGAMYRAMTLAILRAGLSQQDSEAIAQLATNTQLVLLQDRVLLNGADVTALIRTSDVAKNVYLAADHPHVRAIMVEAQRAFAQSTDTVTEGRDQGTVAFPDSQCKIYLTASLNERARRRQAELAARGEVHSLESIAEMIRERDFRDENRAVGALRRAPDSELVETDGLTQDEVIDRLEAIVRSKM